MTQPTNEVARREQIGSFDPQDDAILQYLGLNRRDPKSRAVVAVARRYNLDPLLKHVVVIPTSGVYITRDGLLHTAHESGQLDGIVVELEPTLSEDGSEWVARVTVYRKDMSHGFTFPGRYPVKGGNAKYAQEMALKAAESHALRRAFDVTGLPAEDEERPDPEPQRRVRAADVVAPACEPDAGRPEQQATDAEVVEAEVEWPEAAQPPAEEGGES